jgi:hypothetical protein
MEGLEDDPEFEVIESMTTGYAQEILEKAELEDVVHALDGEPAEGLCGGKPHARNRLVTRPFQADKTRT